MFSDQVYRTRLGTFFTEFFCEADFRPNGQPSECVINHAVAMEVDLAFIRCRNEAVVSRNLRNSPMSLDLVKLDRAARSLRQGLDLASGGRESVLDRNLNMHVALVIGRLVADHDVLVGRMVTQMLIR